MSLNKVNKTTGELTGVAGSPANAAQVAYSNTESGLTAGNVQSAIDELSKNERTFYGTLSDWTALSVEKKKQYSYTVFSDSTAVATPSNRKIIFVSDSYGQHPTMNEAWDAQAAALLGLAVGDYYRWSEGSMGFMHRGSGGHTTKELCQANASGVNEPLSITDIVILEGLNDAYYATVDPYTLSDLSDAVAECLSYLKQTYPNATIWIGTAGNMINIETAVYDNLLSLPRIFSSNVLDVGGKYLTGVENVLHWYPDFDDAQHPGTDGALHIAQYVVAALTGTSFKFFGAASIRVSGSNGNTLTWDGTIADLGDKITVQLDSTALVFGTSPTPAFTDVELGTYDARVLGHPFMKYLRCPTTLIFNGVFIPAEVKFVPPTTHSTSGQASIGKVLLDVRSYSGPALTSGIINGFCFTIPAELC